MRAYTKERYELLLKPSRPIEIIQAVERALPLGGFRD